MNNPKKSIREVVEKEMPEFASEVASLKREELDARISSIVEALEDLSAQKETDERLAEAQAVASELLAPYKEAGKALKLKVKYLVMLSKETA